MARKKSFCLYSLRVAVLLADQVKALSDKAEATGIFGHFHGQLGHKLRPRLSPGDQKWGKRPVYVQAETVQPPMVTRWNCGPVDAWGIGKWNRKHYYEDIFMKAVQIASSLLFGYFHAMLLEFSETTFLKTVVTLTTSRPLRALPLPLVAQARVAILYAAGVWLRTGKSSIQRAPMTHSYKWAHINSKKKKKKKKRKESADTAK
ncbi:hypothetical protein BDZ91DRAFT_766827 [Kalaharituber pfeilii]|nr:hypothetical protein BDZ91DRAFT_766827 [Kalaharituber pfeilii]